jgi:hypothetical protein
MDALSKYCILPLWLFLDSILDFFQIHMQDISMLLYIIFGVQFFLLSLYSFALLRASTKGIQTCCLNRIYGYDNCLMHILLLSLLKNRKILNVNLKLVLTMIMSCEIHVGWKVFERTIFRIAFCFKYFHFLSVT